MSDSRSSRSTWDVIQSFILLLTPVLVAVLGYFFNRSLTNLESKIANVSAMKPFMEMVASEDVTESKMGAYAIYLLNEQDNPEMAAQMILAPGESHLLEVLVDIGNRDPRIKAVVNSVLENINITDGDSTSLTDIQKNALEVIDKIDRQTATTAKTEVANEWLYLGNFQRGPSNERLVDGRPSIGATYTLRHDSNVRRGKPAPPSYKMPPFIRIAHTGDQIRIDTFTTDKSGHVWARVEFL